MKNLILKSKWLLLCIGIGFAAGLVVSILFREVVDRFHSTPAIDRRIMAFNDGHVVIGMSASEVHQAAGIPKTIRLVGGAKYGAYLWMSRKSFVCELYDEPQGTLIGYVIFYDGHFAWNIARPTKGNLAQ